jgi:cytochrome c-type protein NapB
MLPRFLLVGAVLLLLSAGCERPPGPTPVFLAPSAMRAERRAYDGAPPVIPHKPLGGACTSCHATEAREVPGVGVAVANPHRHTPGLSEASRCQQCHVFKTTDSVFVASTFQGLAQDLRPGERMYAGAPPVIPHAYFMREDCASCHTGASARPEFRCTHPERTNCLQCHARTAR